MHWKKGDPARALEEDLRRAEAHSPGEGALAALKGMFAEIVEEYRHGGDAAAHRCILKHRKRAGELISDGKSPEERGCSGLGLVVHYAEAGDLDTAFEHLEEALDVRDPALVHLAVAPQWDCLRADPRFNECLARMKLRPVL